MTPVRAVRAEFGKALSLPAVWIALAVTLGGTAAITILNVVFTRADAALPAAEQVYDASAFEAGFAAMPIIGVVGAIIVGVVVMSSEYAAAQTEAGGARQIATSLVAVPRRGVLFASKAIVVATIVLASALVTIPGSIGLATLMLQDLPTDAVPAVDAVWRSVGATVYWLCMGLIAFAITALVRSGIVPLIVLIANSSLVSFTLLLTNLTPLANWLPDMAGRNLFGFPPDSVVPGGLDAVPGGIVMAAWAAVLLVIAGIVFARRDA